MRFEPEPSLSDPLEERLAAALKIRRSDPPKTGRLGRGERLFEILFGNVPTRLDHQELGARSEGVGDVTEEPDLVRHLVRDVQHGAEID